MKSALKRLLFWLLLPSALVGCGGGVEVDAVWGRVSPAGAANGAFYMEITNNGREEVALVAVRSPACETVELHESRVEDGVMRMAPVAEIVIPAGATVALRTGGLHAMCVGLRQPLALGRQIPLTLVFADVAQLSVEAEIRDQAP